MYSILHYIRKIYSYIDYFVRPYIVIDGFFRIEGNKLFPNNFGDDINFPLIEVLTGKKTVHISQSPVGRVPRLMAIGSIIESCMNQHSVIWGSGMIYGDKKLHTKPKKIYAVRGPLTREAFLNQGIDCPDVYGDPALLLPLLYSPAVSKQYKYGIIPHYVDYDLPHVKKFRDEHPEILFIKLRGYTTWKEVIDQINSCEHIISSSLHGLIVSDAYGIPNARVVFSDAITGGNFKYMDYCAGVGREYINPVLCYDSIDIKVIDNILNKYVPIAFNPAKLLNVFPYKLAKQFKS